MSNQETPFEDPGNAPPHTVLHSRSLSDLSLLQADLVGADARVADLFLRFVQETAACGQDTVRLMHTISDFSFRAFPQATHLVLAVVEEDDGIRPEGDPGDLYTLYARSRTGEVPSVALSRTLVRRVMAEGVAVLFSDGETESASARSILFSGIRTALCAPLSSLRAPFGVIQLDVRQEGRGVFHRKDLDRLTVFSHHVALVLETSRLYQEQTRALQSTVNALVHSLSLKDPATALHSERVQAVALRLGREFRLSEMALEALGMAAILHDLGKHGVRDEVLSKPGRLSQGEHHEMSQHAGLTENILDKIYYPAHLRHVPVIAAYHHEKMDGSGPYGLPGDKIPLQARIISVADAFDALVSPRSYKKAFPMTQVMNILREGANRQWDPEVVEMLDQVLDEILATIYPGRDRGETTEDDVLPAA